MWSDINLMLESVWLYPNRKPNPNPKQPYPDPYIKERKREIFWLLFVFQSNCFYVSVFTNIKMIRLDQIYVWILFKSGSCCVKSWQVYQYIMWHFCLRKYFSVRVTFQQDKFLHVGVCISAKCCIEPNGMHCNSLWQSLFVSYFLANATRWPD